jgi:hypothetical protein
METSTLMWKLISYELIFQRNMPRFMFRADNKVVLSEMKFIRWKKAQLLLFAELFCSQDRQKTIMCPNEKINVTFGQVRLCVGGL